MNIVITFINFISDYLRYNTIIGIYTRQVRIQSPLYHIDRVMVFEKNTRIGAIIINDAIALKRASGRRNHTTFVCLCFSHPYPSTDTYRIKDSEYEK